jgi:3-oxoacyl-[acyl-carrier protein] reductase
MAELNLQGKAAIVTGSATGIGAATARLLAARGAAILVNFTRSRTEAEATVAACRAAGGAAELAQGDVASDGDCRRLVEEALGKWGRLDYLVNNAGTTKRVDHADLDGLSAEDFQRIYAVNTIGAFQMARAAAPHLKAAGDAAIVNVSSTAALNGTGSSIAYAASKAALNAVTMSLARVLAPEIRVNAVCPGFVKTRWNEAGIGAEAFAARVKSFEAVSPLRRSSGPEDVADSILWLLTGARHMTGEWLVVDAGSRIGLARQR